MMSKFFIDEGFKKRVKHSSYGEGGVEVVSIKLIGEDGEDSQSFSFNETVKVQISILSAIDEVIGVAYYVLDDKRNSILGAGPRQANKDFTRIKKDGKYNFTFETRFPLLSGVYSLQIQVNKPLVVGKSAKFLQVIDDAIVFRVEEGVNFKIWSKVHIENSLTIDEA